jgi:hypothetical protein
VHFGTDEPKPRDLCSGYHLSLYLPIQGSRDLPWDGTSTFPINNPHDLPSMFIHENILAVQVAVPKWEGSVVVL